MSDNWARAIRKEVRLPEHLRRQLTGSPELFNIGETFGVVGGQGAVVCGDPVPAGGKGALQQGGVHAGVLFEDAGTQPGLDDKIHLIEQVGRQAGARHCGLMQCRI